MFLDFSSLAPRDAYTWMTHAITPRPIAWVSTISAEGRTNLAPFSFFSGRLRQSSPRFCSAAPTTAAGKKKDSILNVEHVPEFVVNIVPYALREPMNHTAATLPHGESEFEKFGIATAPSLKIRPPRVAAAPVAFAFECKLDRIVRVGEGPLAANVVFGTILCAHVDDAVLGADGIIDPHKLDTIGRHGGELYSRTTELFAIKRPS